MYYTALLSRECKGLVLNISAQFILPGHMIETKKIWIFLSTTKSIGIFLTVKLYLENYATYVKDTFWYMFSFMLIIRYRTNTVINEKSHTSMFEKNLEDCSTNNAHMSLKPSNDSCMLIQMSFCYCEKTTILFLQRQVKLLTFIFRI